MRGVPADKSAAMMAPKQKVEKPMRIMGRLFGYILRRYKLHCLGVLLFIFGSTAATVAGNLFMKTLIADYIVPYIGEGGASDFGPLLAALLKMGCVFLFGVLCTLRYNRIRYMGPRARCAPSATIYSGIWSTCPSVISTPMPTAIS